MKYKEQIKEFLETLFSGLKGYIELRTINSNKDIRQFFYSTNDIERLLDDFDNDNEFFKDVNIYFGVCPREKKMGKEENIKQVNCLWVDLDCGSDEERELNLKKLNSFDPSPSSIVNSGHGYHIYWLLTNPFQINSNKDKMYIKGILKGMCKELNADHCFDLSRVLRMPCTHNLKDPNNPLPVKTISFNPERKYTIQDFEKYKVDVHDFETFNIELENVEIPKRFYEILEKDEKLKNTWEGNRPDFNDSTRSPYDISLADQLLPYGFSQSQIAKILTESPSGKGKDASIPYLKHTINKAIESWKSKGEPLHLEGLLEVYKKWLKIDETDYIEVILATIASNEIGGDPVWVFVVGAPGASKTEILRSLKSLKNVYMISRLTAQSLISGKQTNKYDPSLLPLLDKKTLIIKDFSSILSIQRESRESIFADLREAYDGYLEKYFGNIGKKGYYAHFSIIAGVTPEIDKHTSVQQNLGERFLKIRLVENDALGKIQRAIENTNTQDDMRKEIAKSVEGFFKYLKVNPQKIIDISEDIKEKIGILSRILAICRTSVSRNPYYRKEISYLPETEVGTRIGIQLTKLAISLAIIRRKVKVTEDELKIPRRVVIDSMPKKVKLTIEILYQNKNGITTKKISESANIEYETLRLTLKDLLVLQIVKEEQLKERGSPIVWKLDQNILQLFDQVDIFNINAKEN